MIIGYARVSTQEQNMNAQLDELRDKGAEQIYFEKISGSKRERPELNKMLEHLRPGDKVMVWSLDRLGRSLKDLIDLVATIKAKGADFTSIKNGIDTSTPAGRFTFNVFASLAEFERDIIRERTQAGLQAAKSRGRTGGRPAGPTAEKKRLTPTIIALYNSKNMSAKEIAENLNIGRATVYRILKAAGIDTHSTRDI